MIYPVHFVWNYVNPSKSYAHENTMQRIDGQRFERRVKEWFLQNQANNRMSYFRMYIILMASWSEDVLFFVTWYTIKRHMYTQKTNMEMTETRERTK